MSAIAVWPYDLHDENVKPWKIKTLMTLTLEEIFVYYLQPLFAFSLRLTNPPAMFTLGKLCNLMKIRYPRYLSKVDLKPRENLIDETHEKEEDVESEDEEEDEENEDEEKDEENEDEEEDEDNEDEEEDEDNKDEEEDEDNEDEEEDEDNEDEEEDEENEDEDEQEEEQKKEKEEGDEEEEDEEKPI
ncbi:hypothetical protein KPH14_002209 [Odynerus spinipes]|uniref:Uncharacterized protein n=1 Tax=Odynerus spinipes TaxID=1348599 RepID=A0AAD9RLL5_9HYME|nr:hypothetical protein KPH14_002209 [Odynerus spinipes]